MSGKVPIINPILSDRARLLIMSALAASETGSDFTTLCTALELTKGNLSAHMRKLEDEKFVEVKKQFVDRKPRTTYAATDYGRSEVVKYLEQVQALLKAAKR